MYFSFFPDCSAWVSALTFSSFGDYFKAYNNYLDASGKLKDMKYLRYLARKQNGSEPAQWADSLGIREVAAAGVNVGDSLAGIVALRVSNPSAGLVFSEKVNMKNYLILGWVDLNSFLIQLWILLEVMQCFQM